MTLTTASFLRAATRLGCEVAAIQAVFEVEAPQGGFDSTGKPRILFEGHVFSRLTQHRYDSQAPTVSYREWTRKFYCTGTPDARNTGEHARLDIAARLDRPAALKSASWGKAQIMGENYAEAGFASLQEFINAMYRSEDAHLDAFVAFVQSKGLAPALRGKRWAEFAAKYNGPRYAENAYDTKMAVAYGKAVGA